MEIHPLVYILVILFGSSSWLSINSIWMELSLLTQALPEGWSLPSYLAAVIQVACIGPLIYTIIHKCTKISVQQAPTILFLLVLCTLSTLSMTTLWNQTSTLLGAERSLALIGIIFVMALVNTTSNLLFMPYMTSFHPSYLTAYFVGMGFSALIPSIVSLIQGTMYYECVPDTKFPEIRYPRYLPARFGVTEYNYIMFAWMCLATISFALLHWCIPDEHKEERNSDLCDEKANINTQPDELLPLQLAPNFTTTNFEMGHSLRYWTLILCLALVCAQINSIIPSVQSFASLPYSMTTYHLALTISNLIHPIASFLPLWLKPKSMSLLISFTAFSMFFTAFVVYLALGSPTPLLYDSMWGAFISVLASVCASSLGSYLRTVLTTLIRESLPHNESRLFWCGVAMQVGSFIGACVMFPLVNIFNVFHPAQIC